MTEIMSIPLYIASIKYMLPIGDLIASIAQVPSASVQLLPLRHPNR